MNAHIENDTTQYLNLSANNDHIRNWSHAKGLKFH